MKILSIVLIGLCIGILFMLALINIRPYFLRDLPVPDFNQADDWLS